MKIDREPRESDEAALRKKRAQRIQDYQRDALDQPDPLQAVLRSSSSDLMEIAGQMKNAFDQALLEEPDLRTLFAEVSPLLEMYLKYQRQVDRFVQLDQRLKTPPSRLPAALSITGKSEEASEESRI